MTNRIVHISGSIDAMCMKLRSNVADDTRLTLRSDDGGVNNDCGVTSQTHCKHPELVMITTGSWHLSIAEDLNQSSKSSRVTVDPEEVSIATLVVSHML